VTFLIPVFGVSWGALFLGETVGWHTLAGAVTVLTGTALVTGVSLTKLWRQIYAKV
jgi:drug/metabolite transporter (DMT)-like permease